MKTIYEFINQLSLKWGLENVKPITIISSDSNCVLRAYSTLYKTNVVLKILVNNTKEPEVLKLFNGNGYVILLDYDPAYRGLLLQDIIPGNTLSTLFPTKDAVALEIMASLVKKASQIDIALHENEFETISDWLQLLGVHKSIKIPKKVLQRAQEISKILLEECQNQYLLHGDLHQDNILQCAENPLDSSSWVIIDPKGVIGPIEFEVVRFLFNPLPALIRQSNPEELIQRRIEQLTRIFGFQRQRLIDWFFVQAVLSACWAERGGGQEFLNYFIEVSKYKLN